MLYPMLRILVDLRSIDWKNFIIFETFTYKHLHCKFQSQLYPLMLHSHSEHCRIEFLFLFHHRKSYCKLTMYPMLRIPVDLSSFGWKNSSFLNQLLTSTFIASSSLNFILWCDIVTVSIAWSGSCFCSITASHTASWPCTPCWEFWWTWDHLIGKISSFYNLQSPLLQISVSIRSLEVASEHLPPMQVLLLVFSPFPQVLLHSE